jgi:hypothetical protein
LGGFGANPTLSCRAAGWNMYTASLSAKERIKTHLQSNLPGMANKKGHRALVVGALRRIESET